MATDSYFSKVTLLLHMAGADGSTTITDSSATPKAITARYGAAISTAQSKFGDSSSYFDGNDNVLEVAAHADHLFGTGDFTWECWAYFASGSGNQTLISLGINRTLYRASNGYLYYYEPDIGNNVIGAVCPTGQWVHCALTRRAGVLYIFVNGVLGGSAAYTKNLTDSDIWIGKYRTVSSPLNGYIDEVRITREHGRYISNFTVPGEAFPDSAPPPEVEPTFDPIFHKVSLLLHCNGADGSTTYLDNSLSPKTVTPALSAQISTAQSKFGGASAKFTSGDYMTVPESAAFGFGAGDFTVELWVRPALVGDSSQVFIDFRPSDAGVPLLIGCTLGGAVRYYDGATVRTGGLMVADTWNHVAWCRKDNVNTIYLNGLVVSTYTAAQDFGSIKGLCIGVNVIKWAEKFVGNLDEIRITRGTARYTSEFIPTNFPFPNSGPVEVQKVTDPYWENVSLLARLNGENNGTSFPDSSQRGLYAVPWGSPKTSTAQSKFGGSAAYFNGAEGISYEAGPWFNMGLLDFTMECWAYFTGTQVGTMISLWENMTLYRADSGSIALYNKSTESNLIVSPVVSNNAWMHVAVCRQSGVWYLFINGDLIGTYTYTVDIRGSNCSIGWNQDRSAPMKGYLNEVRVTKGIARYTESFIPTLFVFPAGKAQYGGACDPSFAKVVLLLDEHGAGWSTEFKDTSKYARVPFVVNTPKVVRSVRRVGDTALYLDGTGGLLVPYSNDLWLPEDFTIEFWFRAVNTTWGMVLNLGGGSSIAWASWEVVWNGSGLSFGGSTANAGYDIGSEGAGAGYLGNMNLNQWYHIAITRQGNSYRGFVDGVQAYSQTLAGGMHDPRCRGLSIGHHYYSYWGNPDYRTNPFTGYLDALRITKGEARYVSGFTPPESLPAYAGVLKGTTRNSLGELKSTKVRGFREWDNSALGTVMSAPGTGEFILPTKFMDEHTTLHYPWDGETRTFNSKVFRGVLPVLT